MNRITRRTFVKGLVALAVSPIILRTTEAEAREISKLEPTATLDEVVRYLEKNRIKKINYSELWPSNYPIISFGENHKFNLDEIDIAEHMDIYKRQGATHLALELDREDFSPIVEDFYKCKINGEELQKILKSRVGSPDSACKLITQAKEVGIKAVCMDVWLDSLFNDQSVELRHILTRNKHMAWVLRDILIKQPQARIIAYAGAAHFGYLPAYEPTATNICPVGTYLSEKGIMTYRVTYAGGPTVNEETEGLLPETITKAARKAGFENETFGVELNEKAAKQNWGNYVIHLPQK